MQLLCVTLLALLASAVRSEMCTGLNCTCTTTSGRTEIDCTSRDLKKLPSFTKIPENVLLLDLCRNKISSIPQLEEIDGLKTLKLCHNDIQVIAPQAFRNYSYLEHLDLSHNRLSNVTALSGLTGLRSLNLSDNHIRSFPGGEFFLSMSELQELRLNGNPLHFLRHEVFRPLSKVTFLDLSACALTSLPEGVFHEMLYLKELHLCDNQFEEVPTAGLQSAPKLKTLTMNRNPFTSIEANSFKKIKYLETLELSDMGSLQSIKSGAFSGLKQLKKLKISHNPNLKELDFGVFGGLYNSMDETWFLQELILRENGLTEIRSPSTTLCKVRTLDLQGNPWNCDCNFIWMTTCELRDELTGDLKCSSPPDKENVRISQLGAEDLVCLPEEHIEHQQKVLRIVVVCSGLVGLLFCVTIIVIVVKKRKIMEWWYYRKRGSGAVYYVKAKTNPQDTRGEI